jgi:hypothetical protein
LYTLIGIEFHCRGHVATNISLIIKLKGTYFLFFKR